MALSVQARISKEYGKVREQEAEMIRGAHEKAKRWRDEAEAFKVALETRDVALSTSREATQVAIKALEEKELQIEEYAKDARGDRGLLCHGLPDTNDGGVCYEGVRWLGPGG